jgi:hypothetical protein
MGGRRRAKRRCASWARAHGINAIPAVRDAEPGVLTQLDLGVLQPRGLVRPRSPRFGEPLGV